MKFIPWEKHPENAKHLDEFKRAYADHSIQLTLIKDTFKLNDTSIAHSIAKRLGIPVRPPKFVKSTTKVPPVTALANLTKEEQELQDRLQEIREQKMNLTVRCDRDRCGNVSIYGLLNQPITVPLLEARAWLDGHGPTKLREVVGNS